MNYLIQPKKYKSLMADEGSKAIMDKTIVFFENMGKQRRFHDYNKKIWYREFIDFLARERIFFKLLTPKQYAEGDPDGRERRATASIPSCWPSTGWDTGTASR